MTASTLPPLATDWLDHLRTAADRLPAAERSDLVSEIEAHLMESIPPGASEAQVREVLDRMGDPGKEQYRDVGVRGDIHELSKCRPLVRQKI